MHNVMREDCPKSPPYFQPRFFSIKIDYSLQGRMYVIILQESHHERLNSSFAIFISLCASTPENIQGKRVSTPVFYKCTFM